MDGWNDGSMDGWTDGYTVQQLLLRYDVVHIIISDIIMLPRINCSGPMTKKVSTYSQRAKAHNRMYTVVHRIYIIGKTICIILASSLNPRLSPHVNTMKGKRRAW